MHEDHRPQFIRFDCKICGKTFSRVPYAYIVQHRIAQCSSCGTRFILDGEEIQAALLEALSEAEQREHTDITAAQPVSLDTARKPAESISANEEPSKSAPAPGPEGHQPLSTEETFDSAIYQEFEQAKSPAAAEPEELTIEERFDISQPRIFDAGHSSEIEEFLDFGDEENLETEEPGIIETRTTGKPFEIKAGEALEIEEPLEPDAEESLEIEEPLEPDAEESLDIEEPLELDAEESLEIEEPLELDAEESLEIEKHLELDAEESLDIEEPLELDAEESLEIEKPLELDEDISPVIAPVLTTAMPDIQQPAEKDPPASLEATLWPDMALPGLVERFADKPSVSQQAETTAAVFTPPETSRPLTGFEPEKEDKIEFARRLSRLIPEGWVKLPQQSAEAPGDGTRAHQEASPEPHPGEGRFQYIICALGDTECAVPVENTTEIGLVPELTRVPNVPGWLLGIANLRGDIVSLVDIKRFLGMGSFDPGINDRIIMLRSRREDLGTAVIVNRIAGMHYVADEDIVMASAGDYASTPYISGVYERDGRSIAVLDIESMLLSDDMQQFQAL